MAEIPKALFDKMLELREKDANELAGLYANIVRNGAGGGQIITPQGFREIPVFTIETLSKPPLNPKIERLMQIAGHTLKVTQD